MLVFLRRPPGLISESGRRALLGEGDSQPEEEVTKSTPAAPVVVTPQKKEAERRVRFKEDDESRMAMILPEIERSESIWAATEMDIELPPMSLAFVRAVIPSMPDGCQMVERRSCAEPGQE